MLVTLTSASKTFNLAGCQNAFAIIPDKAVRAKWDAFTQGIKVQEGSSFGYIAMEAAYRGGGAWLEQVLAIIWGNYRWAKNALEKALPHICVSPLEGTYLMWVDFSAYLQPDEMETFFQKACHVAVDYGSWFGGDAACHVRINLATCRENVETAVNAVISGLQDWGRL